MHISHQSDLGEAITHCVLQANNLITCVFVVSHICVLELPISVVYGTTFVDKFKVRAPFLSLCVWGGALAPTSPHADGVGDRFMDIPTWSIKINQANK